MNTGEQNLMGKPSQVIRFNKLTGQLEKPTILLKTRGGNTIGELQYTNLNLSFVGKGLDNLSFDVHKMVNGKECKHWDRLIDLCIVDYVGYGQFECNVTINDEDETIKSCVCESLETELGQHTIRDMHINDEDAITYGRDIGNTNIDFTTGETSGKFIPTVLYDENDKQHSLLDIVLAEKTPHWSVGYVSPQFAVNGYVYDADQIERTFTISGSTPYDFFESEVSQEFDCVFTYDTYNRKVNCYNLDDCVYDTTTNEIKEGYYRIDGIYYDENDNQIIDDSNLGYCSGIGQDTTIFMSKSKLANSFSIDSDKDSVKNCFYVSGGDDEITNIIAAANVTGDNYIYMFGNFQYEDMSDELVDKIKSYATLLLSKEEEFNKVGGVYVYDSEGKYVYNIGKQRVEDKNGRIIVTSKYENGKIYVLDTLAYYENGVAYSRDGLELSSSDYVYDDAGLYTEYTSLVDRINYWEHTRFPDVTPSDTTAKDEMQKIISHFHNTQVYIRNGCTDDSFAHVTSAIETLAGIVCDSRYTIKIYRDNDHALSCTTVDKDHIYGNWNGVVYIKRTTNETDYIEFNLGANITLSNDIDSDINFCKQNMDIAISKLDIKELDFTKLTDDELRELLKEYNLNSLKSFRDGFDSCRATLNDLLANMELENAQIPQTEDNIMLLSMDKYNQRYIIANELYEELFEYVESLKSQQETFETTIKNFREELDIKTFFGETLWKEFRSYVREDEYNNPNYISDGLTNCEILEKAKELLDVAKKELSKACVIQKTISGDINNIFSLEEKETLHDKFALFNYVRVRADDNIYKLRLMEISFSEDNPEKLNVIFSEQIEDVTGKKSDVQKILEQSQSIATTYSSTTKQAKQGAYAMSNFNTLKQDGLDSSLYLIKNSNTEEVTFDNTGLSCKSMLDQGIYSPYEVRVTHNGIYMSEDNFNSVKTALGRFKYNDEWVYGLCTDVLFGDLIIGEKMLISNKNGSVEIDGDGITLDSGTIRWKTKLPTSDIDGLDSKLQYQLDQAQQGISDAADALSKANNAYIRAENAEKNAKGYADDTISNFDKAVAEYLQVPGATTIIGGNHIISPYIEGGYSNITNGNKQVIIDPSNQTNTGYIFAVKNGTEFTVGIEADGTTNIKGHLTALSLDLSNCSNKISTDYVSGLSTVATSGKASDLTDISNYVTSTGLSNTLNNYLTTDSAKNTYVANTSVIISDPVTDSTTGITTQKITVGNKTFDYVDSGDFICTNIGIGKGSSNPSTSTSTDTYVMIDKNGCLTADNAVIRGSIYATNGYFSGELRAATGSFTGNILSINNDAYTRIINGSIYVGKNNVDFGRIDYGTYNNLNGVALINRINGGGYVALGHTVYNSDDSRTTLIDYYIDSNSSTSKHYFSGDVFINGQSVIKHMNDGGHSISMGWDGSNLQVKVDSTYMYVSMSTHNHDSSYSKLDHNHDNIYSKFNHNLWTHDITWTSAGNARTNSSSSDSKWNLASVQYVKDNFKSKSSDERVKCNFNSLPPLLDTVFDNLKVQEYEYKDGLGKQGKFWGETAQHVNCILEQNNLKNCAIVGQRKVDYDNGEDKYIKDGVFHYIDVDNVTWLCVDQIQKLKKRVSELESEIQQIKQQN